MATLAGTKPKDTYGNLLQIPNSNNGADSTLRQVQDGKGNNTPLKLSTSKMGVGNILDLESRINNVLKDNVSKTAHTGTASETLIASILIPAGKIEANDILRISATLTRTGAGGNCTVKLYVNTSASLSGATLLGQWTAGTSATWSKAQREMVFKNSLSSQEIFPSGAAINFDVANQNTAITTLSNNYAVDQYLIISFQLANTGDTATLRSWYAQILR